MRGHIESRYKTSHTIIIDQGRGSDGKRKRITKNFKGELEDAEIEMLRMLQELYDGTYIKPSKLPLSAILNQWLADHKSCLAPRTYESYKMICDIHLAPALGHVVLSELKPLHVSKYKTDTLALPRSPQTVKYHMTVLNMALDFAVKMQIIKTNPVKNVDKPKVEKKKFKMPTAEEIAQLMDVAREHTIYPIVFTALYTGMRLGEVLALHWEDVDLKEGHIHIRRQIQRIIGEGLQYSEPKAHSAGIIDISGNLVQLLQSLKPGDDAAGLVFITSNNSPYDVRNVSKMFGLIAKKAKVDITFHGLRHAHASILLDAGEPVPSVQERLRHKQPSTTVNMYGHVLPHRPRQTADRFEQAMASKKEADTPAETAEPLPKSLPEPQENGLLVFENENNGQNENPKT